MSKVQRTGLLVACIIGAMISSVIAEEAGSKKSSPAEIFNQRIMPIFRSPKPSSCVQCHLASVDLKHYILPSSEKTFASLRDQGLINLSQPEKSKILTLIRMGEKDLDKGAKLIHEKMRRAEYEAFAEWIRVSSQDPSLRDLPRLTAAERAGPPKPNEVIRHARKSRVVDSFVRNVWSQRMRCFPCHTPHEIDKSNPKHQGAIKTQKKFEELGAALVKRIRIFKKTPEETLQFLIQQSENTPNGQLPLINLKNPRNSLLVLKPTSKLPKKRKDGTFEPPSASSHLGGLKMHVNDQSYKSFIAWIQDYANVVGDRYATVDELPADNWYASKRVLKLMAAPADWPVGTPIQMFVYAQNTADGTWQTEPLAFTQGTVTPRRMVNGALFVLATMESRATGKLDRENASLPRGNYLVKVYADTKHLLHDDPTLLLGSDAFVGQAELKRARWRVGFRQSESISGNVLKMK